MGLSDKIHNDIAISRLVQQHFRMASRNHLTTLRIRGLSQNPIDLPLPQNFQVGVRLIQQEHGPWVRVEVRQKKQSLLEAPA